MYFRQFPKIWYDFPQDLSSTQLQILTDITINVRLRKQALENITLYDEYDMQDGETPEIVAEKIYGNPELHWVIMLVNQRYDYIKDFPMSSSEIYNYVIQKYGESRIYDIHHYEKDNLIVEGIGTLKLPKNIADKVVTPTYGVGVNSYTVCHDYLLDGTASDSVTLSRIESLNRSNNTAVVRIQHGTFTVGQVITLFGVRTDSTGVKTSGPVAQFTVSPNSFTLNDMYAPITNYLYEVGINEEKRRIKIISPLLVDQFVKEFTQLVTPV